MTQFLLGTLCLALTWLISQLVLSHPIVNGVIPPNPGQFRFAVSLQFTQQRNGTLTHFCGGTYLGAGWILTANHCIAGFGGTKLYAFIGGGDLNGGNSSDLYQVEEVISYPHYNRITLSGDIALLRVNSDYKETGLELLDKTLENSLLLPSSSKPHSGSGQPNVLNLVDSSHYWADELDLSEECHIFGYGSASFYGPGNQTLLQYGSVQPLGHDQCVEMLGAVVAPETANSGMFCAIGIADACRGDSGGGLLCRRRTVTPFEENDNPYTLRGIISYGIGCGVPASPGVYTDVSFYREWINVQMSNLKRMH